MGGFGEAAFLFIKAIFVGTSAGGAYALAVNVARIGLLALSAKVFSPKPDFTETAASKRLTIRDPIAPQTFTYGQDMVSGPIVFSNVGGNENRDLYMVICIAGHEIDSVTKYRIDSTDIELASLSGSEDGDVTGGKYDGVARVDLRKGTSTQTVVPNLSSTFPAQYGSSHTGRGWAYMVWEFNLVEGSEDVYKTQPQNVRAVIKGKKVYDPRLDSTNGGSGSHRLATESTWEWSDNPALCLADFIRDDKFGMREEDDRVDWAMVATAADVCDELVDVPPAASPANTQKRYTCGATFSATESRESVRDELLSSMLGRMVFSQGVWKIWAGESVTPDVTLTEANLAGGITLQASAPSAERYNRVRGKFIDPARDYVASTYPEQRSSTYVSADGGEIRELVADFTSCQNEYEAQRKAIVTLKQSRQQRVVVFEGNYSCFRIQPGTTVNLDVSEFGFSGEKFFVTDWSFNHDGVTLTMIEEIDTAWSDPAVGEYATRSATGVLTFGETGVPAPTGLSVTSVPGGVNVSWTNPIQNAFDRVEIWRADENVRGSATLVGTSQGTVFFDAIDDITRLRYYWIRAVDSLGRVSDWEPNLTTTTAQAYAGFGEQKMVADPFIRLGASYWDVSDGRVNYRTGEGTDSTDAISLDTTSVPVAFYTAKRRGPTWDVIAPGKFTVEIRYRVAVRDVGVASFWSLSPFPVVRVTDEGSPENAETYVADITDLHTFTQSSTEGEWFDQTAVVEVDDEGNGTIPRYIQIGFFLTSAASPEFMWDFIDAKIVGRQFGGSGQTGLVPSAAAANQSTDFLKADGTWDAPAGGSSSNSFETMTVTDTDSGFSWSDTGSAVADSATDTLTLVSGTGIDIDVDAASDAIRVSVTNALPVSTSEFATLRANASGGWVEETGVEINASAQLTASQLIASDTVPWISLVKTDASANEGNWRMELDAAEDFEFSTYSDGAAQGDIIIKAVRGVGNVVGDVTLFGRELVLSSSNTVRIDDVALRFDAPASQSTNPHTKMLFYNQTGSQVWQVQISSESTGSRLQFIEPSSGEIWLEFNTTFGLSMRDGEFRISEGSNESHYSRFFTTSVTNASLARMVLGGVGNVDKLELNGMSLYFVEQASANEDITARGQLFVNTSQQLIFRDELGTETDLTASSGVAKTGTPVNNQIAIWTDASTIEGDADFTWDGAGLNIGSAGANFSRFFRNGATELQLQSTPQLRMTTSSAVFDAGAGGTVRATNALVTVQADLYADNSGGILESDGDWQIKSIGITDFLTIINTNTQQTLRAPTNNQIRLQVGTDNCVGGAAGGHGVIYGAGSAVIQGQSRITTGNTSGAYIFDHAGNQRDIGFNHVIEISQTTGSITLDDIHAGAIIRRTGSSNVSVTMAASSAFPIGSMVTILNHGTGGTFTISDGSEAMYIMDGSGAVTDSTGFALAIGGAITVWRQGLSAYYVWGAGIP